MKLVSFVSFLPFEPLYIIMKNPHPIVQYFTILFSIKSFSFVKCQNVMDEFYLPFSPFPVYLGFSSSSLRLFSFISLSFPIIFLASRFLDQDDSISFHLF